MPPAADDASTIAGQQAAAPAASSPAGDVIRRFRETLRKTQFMPPDAMRVYQRGLLERLVRHARVHVPFYRDGRLASLFRADDTIDWDRWPELVPVTRKELQDEHHRLKAEFIGPEHGRTWTLATSGSTGEPVKTVHTELSGSLAWTTIVLRDCERHGIDLTRRLAQLYPFTPDDFDICGTRRHQAWFPELVGLGIFGERFDLADTRPPDELVAAVVSLRPAYLHVQPTTLELMLAHDRDHALARIGLDGVICYGEHLSQPTRREAERHLRCRIVDFYGSNECGFIASTCAHCGRYHVHAETMLVEVLDGTGSWCRPGDVGQTVVTPLYNYAMPLIRYDHGDDARLAGDGACVIRLPTLDEIIGKKRMPFVFAGDRAIRPTLPSEAVVDCLGARTFQVAQVAPDRCEFRIVPGSLRPAEMKFDAMTELLRQMWWRGLQVDYVIVDDVPRRSARAKIQQFVCELRPAASAS